jgi:hypothetical protein
MMKYGVVALLTGGIHIESVIIPASPFDVVISGKYAGGSFTDALDNEFYNLCRKANPALPVDMISEDDEEPENYPSCEDGYYEFGEHYVYMTEPRAV